MKVAYADPPYIGQAKRHYGMEEVDHKELIDVLCLVFDAWALSCSSQTLQQILPLCPQGIRTGAWVKPFCAFKKNVNPAYAWEPVIFYGGRNMGTGKEIATIRDWIAVPITLKKGLTGAKPKAFCYWIFGMLGLQPDDELHDLYPGTGIVSECWEQWRSNPNRISDLQLAQSLVKNVS